MNHNTLGNYYETLFALAHHHKWSVTEIEDMIPFERDLYVKMLMEYLEELKEKQRQQQNR